MEKETLKSVDVDTFTGSEVERSEPIMSISKRIRRGLKNVLKDAIKPISWLWEEKWPKGTWDDWDYFGGKKINRSGTMAGEKESGMIGII